MPEEGKDPEEGEEPEGEVFGAGEDPEEGEVFGAGEDPEEGEVFRAGEEPECEVFRAGSTSSNPTEMSLKFLTPELIDHIVVETNRYASFCLSSSHTGDGPVPQWETDSDEMKAYFGFCILMGMNKLPDLYDYWSSEEAFHYMPVASRISRKRFLEIQRYLHFANNDNLVNRGEPGYDRLGKVRPVIDAVRQTFLVNYRPHMENSVDEAMIKYKGRSTMKQYLPMKPIKRGFKVWVRADGQNGYMCDLEVYTGKDTSTERHLGAKVVRKLSRPLEGGRYHIYFDNFFSTLDLFDGLLEDGLYACGTFRKDRKGIPADVSGVCAGISTSSTVVCFAGSHTAL